MITEQQLVTQRICAQKLKRRTYVHVSAPIVPVKRTDPKTGIETIDMVVQRPGKTLKLHGDRRMRLTMERIKNGGLGRGAVRRKRLREAREGTL